MKVGIVGCGKLGLPVAVALDSQRDLEVYAYDINPDRMRKDNFTEKEDVFGVDFREHLEVCDVHFTDLETLVEKCELVFVAVQTPHDREYEGIMPRPDTVKDFDYAALEGAVRSITHYAKEKDGPLTVAVISTVLPGTMRERIYPILDRCPNVSFVYTPSFIAMGTVIPDYLYPEFILLGIREYDGRAQMIMEKFISKVEPWKQESTPVCMMSVESAELTKVAYNTCISAKIAYANFIMEICDKIPGANCDEVIDALSCAKRRIISPLYMRGGMGDGGGCHPRDNIAMSSLAKKLKLTYDYCNMIMEARECQSLYLADLAVRELSYAPRLTEVVLLGSAFKAGTNLTIGSPAVLLKNQLENIFQSLNIENRVRLSVADPHVREGDVNTPLARHNWRELAKSPRQALYIITCRHEEFANFKYPEGSIVIDPHRYVSPQTHWNIRLVRVGDRAYGITGNTGPFG